MKSKKIIKLIFSTLFWVTIFVLIKSQTFKTDKNPYILGIVLLVFIGHIVYEGVYLKNKVASKKTKLKSKQLTSLKTNKTLYTPKIDNKILPSELIDFIPLFEKWGIDNDLLRDDFYNKATKDELFELKTIESKREIIDRWLLNNSVDLDTYKAIRLTIKAYDDLGLWTWEQKI